MRHGRMSILIAACAVAIGVGRAYAERENIALNAPYKLDPAPNYAHCTDPGDATQLTDGELTEGYFWTQEGTVGWRWVKYATITVDLGKVQPIAGVSFRTAAGKAGVVWPAAIRIQVSDDGEAYRDVGDLLELDTSARPLPDDYAVRRLETLNLKTRGRYVRFLIVPVGRYIFCDEVEVFRGDDRWLDRDPGGHPVDKVETQFLRFRVESGLRRRFDRDTARLSEVIAAADLQQGIREELGQRAAKVRDQLQQAAAPNDPAGFQAILPFNEAHAAVFRIQAALWNATGHDDLTIWPVDPWDPTDPFAPPGAGAIGSLEVHTMRGEYRSAAFNLANSTQETIEAIVRFEDLPGGTVPHDVTLYEVPWTDTVSGRPVTAALMPASSQGDGWKVKILPGLIRQVWLTFHVTGMPAGVHRGRVVIAAPGQDDQAIPLELHVYPLTFPKQTTLHVGGWSYTDGRGRYGITPENREALVRHLQERFVNAPWATAGVMMKYTFKEGADPSVELDTSIFDEWLAQWPEAQQYYVFLSVGRRFAGTSMGTPEFNQRVGTWITAWVEHLAGKGISADRLSLLLVDEPHSHEKDEIIIGWARAIKAAEPEVVIWEDPAWRVPKEGTPEMYAVSDVLCPNRPMWLGADKSFAEFYLDQQTRGKTLQLYSCSGPARLLDPYAYYRLQAWHAWSIGATGSFFWAFGDNGKASSWNEYASAGGPYTPLFLDDSSVTGAKQMEAIRESAQDYEYFVMLSEAVQRARDDERTSSACQDAQRLLDQAVGDVLTAQGVTDLHWHAPKNRERADRIRVELLQSLANLTANTDQ